MEKQTNTSDVDPSLTQQQCSIFGKIPSYSQTIFLYLYYSISIWNIL